MLLLHFSQNDYHSALVPWNLLSSYEKCHCPFCKMLYLKCLTVFWICLCLNNCSVVCTVTLCYVLHQTHSEFWHIQNYVYSGISRHIQRYSALLRHIHVYWDIMNTYSLPCVTLTYSQPCHILSPDIFRTRGIFEALTYLEPEAYSKP